MCVQKAAPAEVGSGVSGLAAYSRPVGAEVMEMEEQTVDLRPKLQEVRSHLWTNTGRW